MKIIRVKGVNISHTKNTVTKDVNKIGNDDCAEKDD